MRAATAPVLVCALLAACDDAPGPSDTGGMDAAACGATSAVVEIGTTTSGTSRTYRALGDGDPVYVSPGPQGGQHIWIGLRGQGFDPSLPRIELRAVRPSDDALVGRLLLRSPMGPAPEDPTRRALDPQTLRIVDSQYCALLGGGALRIELEFNDGRGHCATVRRTVRVVDIDPETYPSIRDAWLRCCTARLPRCYPNPDLDLDAAAPPG